MDFTEFINNIIDALEIETEGVLSKETELESIENWGSLAVVNIMLMADEQYGKSIAPKEIRQCVTIGDLFELIQSK